MAIKDLKNNERATDTFGILALEELPTKAGGTYLNLTLSDKEHNLYEGVKLWSTTKDTFKSEKGKVIEAEVMAKEYRGLIGFEIIKYKVTDLPIKDFVHSSKYDAENLYQMVLGILKGLPDTGYASVTLALYDKYHEQIVNWSAAKSRHHNFKGGLIEHICRMVLQAQNMVKLYPILNAELLICATSLHDLGKIVELDTDDLGAAEYTATGSLLGHAYIGAKMIEEEFKALFPDKEKDFILPLIHCILTHHGKQEWGAVTTPIMAEAYALFLIDMFDSRMKMFEEALEPLHDGDITASYDKALGSLVYKAPLRETLVQSE